MSNELIQDSRPPGQLKIHHIGFVLDSIQESAEAFAHSLGATWDGNIVFDPLQKVRVTFLQGAHIGDAQIELVEPAGPDSPVLSFLEKRGGLHHICYEVDDLVSHLEHCKSNGMIIVRTPVPAVAFGGRHIAWVLTRKRLLLEFLES
jgi:methylmalonyl-CoA/ethylmalonyl-CoA epimerase